MAKKRKPVKKLEWISFDTAIIVLIIIALVVLFKAALTSSNSKLKEVPAPSIEDDATILMSKLTGSNRDTSLINSNELVEEKIKILHQMSYQDIKHALGVKNDFCIFLEDLTGNVVTIDGINTGIGSSKIYINGQPCS